MDDKYQYIPFPIPDHLFQFFAHQVRSRVHKEGDLVFVPIDRGSNLGKSILRSLSEDPRRASRKSKGEFFIRVSNYSGNNYRGTPMGKRQFLKMEQAAFEKLRDSIKSDFDNQLITFVEGAEFAHRINGWRPEQKRKGIRKHAILQFCKKHRVNTRKRTVEALFKLVQRHISRGNRNNDKASRKFAQVLSF